MSDMPVEPMDPVSLHSAEACGSSESDAVGGLESSLILDCRSQEAFARRHLRGAHHVALPSILLKRLKKGTLSVPSLVGDAGGREALAAVYPRTPVLLVAEEEGPPTVSALLRHKLSQDGVTDITTLESLERLEPSLFESPSPPPELAPLLSGLADISLSPSFPGRLRLDDDMACTVPLSPSALARVQASELCYKSHRWRPQNDGSFPVRILPYLYLGNAGNAADRQVLEKYGIRHVLNVTPDLPNSFEEEDGFHYLQLAVSDHWSQNLAAHFPAAIAFIESAREEGGTVLVHCLAGISRSVTVTVAYLMARQGKSLDAAYELVKAAKPNVSPNFNFMGQLLDFERSLAASPDSGRASSTEDEPEAHPPPPPIFLSPTITLQPPPLRRAHPRTPSAKAPS